ncbi:hypothetical protein K445DRAFT_301353 [Daldinia sp. EC12]|nr:hypothetical protein K445DRAFT_301353 [Daldinia sp. EC12]
MASSNESVATRDVGTQTDVAFTNDGNNGAQRAEATPAPAPAPAREANGLERGIVNPPLLGGRLPTQPLIRQYMLNRDLVVELLGCGTDFQGHYRAPFRSVLPVVAARVDFLLPDRGTVVIFPNRSNIRILMWGLSYLLDHKVDAYANYRARNQYFPYWAFRRRLLRHETEAVKEAAHSVEWPQDTMLRLYLIDRQGDCVRIPNGGRLLFVRRRADGWTTYCDPVGAGEVEVVKKADICLWECEEAIELVYRWLCDLNAGSFPFWAGIPQDNLM